MSIFKRILNWLAFNDAIDDRSGTRSAKPLTERQLLGNKGEDHAAAMLEKRGDALVVRNWSCNSGEIDLVTWHKDTLVFTEVRTRSGTSFGTPAETVDRKKQKKIRRSAHAFLARRFRDGKLPSCRFDVVWIIAKDGEIADSGIIENAFI